LYDQRLEHHRNAVLIGRTKRSNEKPRQGNLPGFFFLFALSTAGVSAEAAVIRPPALRLGMRKKTFGALVHRLQSV
jgi:hypothetical protein